MDIIRLAEYPSCHRLDGLPLPQSRRSERPPIGKLFKSIDMGPHWQRLAWLEKRNITFLRFLDAERGYSILCIAASAQKLPSS